VPVDRTAGRFTDRLRRSTATGPPLLFLSPLLSPLSPPARVAGGHQEHKTLPSVNHRRAAGRGSAAPPSVHGPRPGRFAKPGWDPGPSGRASGQEVPSATTTRGHLWLPSQCLPDPVTPGTFQQRFPSTRRRPHRLRTRDRRQL